MLGLALAATTLPAAVAQALPPHATFSFDPGTPISGQEVTFTSESTPTQDPVDPIPRTIVEERWDLDDDGQYDDASGATATWTFAEPGEHRVGLWVVDSAGEPDTSHKSVRVANQRPVPLIALVPASPSAGQAVALLSNSYDPDGSIAKHEWDLDGDGAFDDATGSYVGTSFGAGGWAIGLRVTDNSGGSAVAVATIFVADPAVPGSQSTAGIRSVVRFMSPFPVVRVSGVRRERGTRLNLLSVSAPIGATVKVRCSGRGCLFKQSTRQVGGRSRSAAQPAPTTGLVRIRGFARRLLRPGAIVRVFVTRADEIGKYTRLRMRRHRFPARVDRCVNPVGLSPLDCPAG